jgi:hypothetical protein
MLSAPVIRAIAQGDEWIHYPDDGGSKHLWNISERLQDCVVQKSRRQSSSYSLLWEPKISLVHSDTVRHVIDLLLAQKGFCL